LELLRFIVSETTTMASTIEKKVEKLQLEEASLSPAERSRIKAKFDKYDADGNGTLDKGEFRQLLEETLNRKISDNLFDRYLNIQFQLSDADFNGVIDFQEFCSLYAKIYTNPELPISMGYKGVSKNVVLEDGSNAPKIEKVQETTLNEEELAACRAKFEKFDADNSGTIDAAELKELLKETMGKKMSEMMIKRYVDMQLNLWDKDDNGQIDFDEFTLLYAKMYTAKEGTATAGPNVGMPLPGMGMPMPGMAKP